MKGIYLFVGIVMLFISCSRDAKFNDGKFSYKIENDVLYVFEGQKGYIIEVFNPEIIKTTWVKSDSIVEENPYFIVLKKNTKEQFVVEEAKDKLRLKTTKIIVEITKTPFVVNYFTKDKEILLQSSKPPVDSSECTTMYFKSPTDECFFGMGQKSIPVNRRGYTFGTRNNHIGGYTKEYATMQVNIPYIYTSKKYGIFFDNPYTGYFDLAKSNTEEWSYRTDGGSYTYFFTYGESLQELQTNYYKLTGYPTIPPKWAFGLLQSKCGYINEDEVYGIVEKFEQNNLPLDAIILDAFWFGGYGNEYPQLMGNFTWLKNQFPDPQGYMARLKSKGIKTLTINEPQINVNSENHKMLAEKDLLMKVDGKPFVQESFWAGSASLLDLSNPDAQSWLWSKQKANVELGLDAFWVDLTEPDVSTPEGEFYGGKEPKIHNIYSFLFAKTLYDGFVKDYPNKRLFNITRAGTAGMHRMGAIHWSGDASKTFLALKQQIPMLIGSAMSGMPHYSSDIGGFTNAWDTITVPWNQYKGGPGVTSPELYTRWFQFGVFSPLLRPHSGEGQSCEPFAFDNKTLEITSKYLNLRYQLIPYIYSYAFKTATTGEQLIKPLFMCFDDEEVKKQDFDYMFGDMLVAPVVENGQTKREVYLPKLDKGLKWVDFWDNTEYEGGKSYNIDAPINKIPVFVKGGSILVLGKTKKFVEQSPDDTLYIKVFPAQYDRFELYEDDGQTMAYTQGEHTITIIESEKKDNTLKITINPVKGTFKTMVKKRTWVVRINQLADVNTIEINDKVLEDDNYSVNKSGHYVEFPYSDDTNKSIKIIIKNKY